LAVKLFIVEVSIDNPWNSVYHTTRFMRFTKIRRSILEFLLEDEELLSGETEVDESYFGGKW